MINSQDRVKERLPRTNTCSGSDIQYSLNLVGIQWRQVQLLVERFDDHFVS